MSNRVFTDVESALAAIDSFASRPEEFELPLSDHLQDPVGINMAVITDRALARGWLPAGFEQRDGYRLYRYSGPDSVEA